MILGDDVLRKGKCNINYLSKTMKLFDMYYKLSDYDGLHVDEIELTSGHKCIDDVIQAYSGIFSGKGQPLGQCNMSELQYGCRQ